MDDLAHRREQIVEQADDVRDPADDSGEFDDPAAMADTYPDAFDGGSRTAAAEAIREYDGHHDRRQGGAVGVPAHPDGQREPRRRGHLDAAAPD